MMKLKEQVIYNLGVTPSTSQNKSLVLFLNTWDDGKLGTWYFVKHSLKR